MILRSRQFQNILFEDLKIISNFAIPFNILNPFKSFQYSFSKSHVEKKSNEFLTNYISKDDKKNKLDYFRKNILIPALVESHRKSQIALLPADFPKEWLGFFHPEDLKLLNPEEIKEFLMIGGTNRILVRYALKSIFNPQKCLGVTFVVDTGSPESIYLGPPAWKFLEHDGNLKIIAQEQNDQRDGEALFTLKNFRCIVFQTPKIHRDANLIGLPLILKLGLKLDLEKIQLGELTSSDIKLY